MSTNFNYNILRYKVFTAFAIITLSASIMRCSSGDKDKAKATNDSLAAIPIDITQVVGIANIEPLQRTLSISSESNGIVEQILADANSELKKGELIMVLSHNTEKAQVKQASSRITTQKASIEQFKAVLASLKIKMANAEKNLDRNNKLFAGGAQTQQQLDQSSSDYNSLVNDVKAAEANLQQSISRLSELEADLAYYEAVLAKKFIKAPSDGKLLSLDVRLGSNISSSTSIGEFAPTGPLIAISEVDELFASEIKMGLKAQVRNQGSSEVLATGTVVFTAPYLKKKSLFADNAANLEDRRVREVRVELNNGDKLLIGSRVECVIQLDKQ